jgi:hypothetical protein
MRDVEGNGTPTLDEMQAIFTEARTHTRQELADGSIICRVCGRYGAGWWPCLVSRMLRVLDAVEAGPPRA